VASLICDPNGRKRIQWVDGEARPTVRLGKMPKAQALGFKVKIEAILSARWSRQPLDKETAEWLIGIEDQLHAKLAAHGLVKPRQGRTLKGWLEAFMTSRKDLKPESRRKLEQTKAKLIKHFGGDRDLYSITPDDGSRWAEWLGRVPEGQDEGKERGLSIASVKTHIGNAKTIFAEALERELITKSPVAHLSGGVTPTSNDRYVTPEEIEKVIEACPDAEWRLLFGLARYAGLRTPSETHVLTVADVDFGGARLTVRSPKTERYMGHEQRIVPICPRLMRLIRERYEAMEVGEERLVTIKGAGARRRKVVSILGQAKVDPWDDTWQTLRRSCEIEWAADHPQGAVSKWIGHSITVSGRLYLNHVPDHLYDRLSKPTEAAQHAAHVAPKGARAAQNPAQHEERPSRKTAQKSLENNGKARDDAQLCASVPNGAGGNRTPVP
jgi:integrase